MDEGLILTLNADTGLDTLPNQPEVSLSVNRKWPKRQPSLPRPWQPCSSVQIRATAGAPKNADKARPMRKQGEEGKSEKK